jgi:hypothetical protein
VLKILTGLFLPIVAFVGISFASPQNAGAEPLWFDIVNEGRSIVLELNASPVDIYSWGPDLLPRDLIFPGESGRLTFDDGSSECWYDLRVVTDRGEAILYDIDLCSIELVRIF